VRNQRISAAVRIGALIFCATLPIGVIALSALREGRLALLDSVLDNWATREAIRVIGTDAIRPRLDLPAELGSVGSVEVLVLVTDDSGTVLSRSLEWPKDIDSSRWGEKNAATAAVSRKPAAEPIVRSAGIVRRREGTPAGGPVLSVGGSPPLEGGAAPILIGSEREVTLRHFVTSGADGVIRWVAAKAGPYTVFAGIHGSVVGRSLVSLTLAVVGLAAIASLIGAVLAQRLLSSRHYEHRALTDWLRHVADGALTVTDPPTGVGDLGDLRTQLVRLHRRLASSLEQAFRFTGDAAHELRSPLTSMQVKVDRLIGRSEPASDLQKDLADIADDIHRLSTLVRRLFWMALADAGRLQIHRAPIDLSKMLREVAEEVINGAGAVAGDLRIDPDIWVDADRTLLGHAIANLIGNAIKHNRPDGWIRISATSEGKETVVSIRNSVMHPLPVPRERVFERFFRGSYARALADGGSGIGLSLAREIARAHGGDVLSEESPGDEAWFSLRLPKGLPGPGEAVRSSEIAFASPS
jgi:signal transduction histidine kinase